MKEEIVAWGHENIRATHKTTLEITKEKKVTPRGDCIIGVKADKSVMDLDERIKERMRERDRIKIRIALPDYGLGFEFHAKGHPELEFTHETDAVIRKSRYVCGRTLAVESEISAFDIDREFVELLKDRKTLLSIKIQV